MSANCFNFRDHLLHLYGPTIAHEEGKGGMLLKPIKKNEAFMLENDSDHDTESSEDHVNKRFDQQSLLGEDNGPPPLPPRSHKNSFVGSFRSHLSSFRSKGRPESASPMHTLEVPQTEVRRRSSSQKEDLDLVRHAFRTSSRVIKSVYYEFSADSALTHGAHFHQLA